MLEPDVLADTVLVRRRIDVLPNSGAISNGLLCRPGFEIVSQGMHVTIGANPRIPEKIPGATDGLPALQNGIAGTGAIPLQAHPGTYPRQTSANDDDIKLVAVWLAC